MDITLQPVFSTGGCQLSFLARRHTCSEGFCPSVKSSADVSMVPAYLFSRGFKLIICDDRFSLPEIPKGWKPDPKRVWEKAKENVAPPPPTEAGVKGQSKLTAEQVCILLFDSVRLVAALSDINVMQRGQALGETPLPTAPRSIFDYISAKDRERIQKLASGASETALPPPPPSSSVSNETMTLFFFDFFSLLLSFDFFVSRSARGMKVGLKLARSTFS